MIFENLFSVAGLAAMAGWLFLLASPLIPVWSDRIAGVVLPLILSLGYVGLVTRSFLRFGGRFGTLADVMELFSYEQAALAAWVHFLAFDLIVGAWICRTAAQRKNQLLAGRAVSSADLSVWSGGFPCLLCRPRDFPAQSSLGARDSKERDVQC